MKGRSEIWEKNFKIFFQIIKFLCFLINKFLIPFVNHKTSKLYFMVNYLRSHHNIDCFDIEASLTTSVCKYLFFYLNFAHGKIMSTKYIEMIPTEANSIPIQTSSTAIQQNHDKFSNLTIILVTNTQPYNLTQKELSFSFNLTLMYLFSHFSIIFLKNDIFLQRSQASNLTQKSFSKMRTNFRLTWQQINIS